MPQLLSGVRVLDLGATGPEDVVVVDGKVVTGVDDGRILRVDPDGGRVDTLADTAGRPLGIESLGDGRLLVCDARRGLLAVDPERGGVEVLCDEVAGRRMRFCNNAAVASGGTVYFSDSSLVHGIDNWRADLIERTASGRLLRRSPDGAVDVIADGLELANGVALAADESYVAVAETGGYRVRRVWLSGERAGKSDLLVELPGFPDNISTGDDGLIWITVTSPREPVLRFLHRAPVLARRLVARLPEQLQPGPKKVMRVQGIDIDGRVAHDLEGPGERYHMVTGVRAHQGRLWFGSLHESAIAVADAPTP